MRLNGVGLVSRFVFEAVSPCVGEEKLGLVVALAWLQVLNSFLLLTPYAMVAQEVLESVVLGVVVQA
jgi:hypothetical protein